MTKKRRVVYNLDAFRQAISAYRDKTMSSVEASKKFGVPESTIRKHKNNTKNHVGSGRPGFLSINQEKYLVALLEELHSIGVRLTKETLSKVIGEYMRKVKEDSENIPDPGRHWFDSFFKRNADRLTMKKEIKLENARRDGFTEEVRSQWFNKLKHILDKNNLHARPAQIWNCDESGFSDETQCEYVCVPSDTKFAFEQHGGTGKAFTTTLLCTNAAGDVIPPLVIYAAKSVNPLWCTGGGIDITYKCSESGWISEYLFTDWFKNCFLEKTKHIDRPLLLVMDNHPTHISVDVIELALENQVILLCLPPHSTHALQPLDVVTFSSAKKVWKKIVSKYFSRTGRKTIRKIDFPSLLKSLMADAFTKRQCVSGFARCGLWPFDGEVMKEKVAKKDRWSKYPTSTTMSSTDDVSENVVSVTNIPLPLNSAFNDDALHTTNSFTSTAQKDAGNEECIWTIIADENSAEVTAQATTNSKCLDDPISMFNYPLTTISSTRWDENDASSWTTTDGIWSTRITGQVILPVEDIEEYVLSSPGNKRNRTNSTDSMNKSMKYSNGSKLPGSNGEIYHMHGEQAKVFHELTSVPIQIPPSSPASAVRSIVTNCLQEMQPPTPPIVSKRVRSERKYGEEITTGGFLQELKEKKAAKDAKLKRPRRAPKKPKNLVIATYFNGSS